MKLFFRILLVWNFKVIVIIINLNWIVQSSMQDLVSKFFLRIYKILFCLINLFFNFLLLFLFRLIIKLNLWLISNVKAVTSKITRLHIIVKSRKTGRKLFFLLCIHVISYIRAWPVWFVCGISTWFEHIISEKLTIM